jgi:3-hydroxymyristoyl/3-hydroxydecanoyl-(acyl carrier protein) dehydratase
MKEEDMSKQPLYDASVVKQMLPHRSPFLFVDRVMEFTTNVRIVAEKDLLPQEVFFAGHFPGRPLMPGVLVTEALAQAAGLLLGLSALEGEPSVQKAPGFLLAHADIKYLTPARPGQTLCLEAGLVKSFAGLFQFKGIATVQDVQVARGRLTLAREKESKAFNVLLYG